MTSAKTKLTIDAALNHLTPVSIRNWPRREMGSNCVQYGSPENFIAVRLVTSGVSGEFDHLQIKWHRDGQLVETWMINLTDAEFESPRKNNPDLSKGGHYWSHDSKFYNYVPRLVPSKVKLIGSFPLHVQPK